MVLSSGDNMFKRLAVVTVVLLAVGADEQVPAAVGFADLEECFGERPARCGGERTPGGSPDAQGALAEAHCGV